jgi:hypothetical protein
MDTQAAPADLEVLADQVDPAVPEVQEAHVSNSYSKTEQNNIFSDSRI